jgi:hypothetical protein
MHFEFSTQLGYFLINHSKCLQFGVKRGHIQKLFVANANIIQFMTFVCAFYAFEFSLFYNHCNHDGDVHLIYHGNPIKVIL